MMISMGLMENYNRNDNERSFTVMGGFAGVMPILIAKFTNDLAFRHPDLEDITFNEVEQLRIRSERVASGAEGSP